MRNPSRFEKCLTAFSKPKVKLATSFALLMALMIPAIIIGQSMRSTLRSDASLTQAQENQRINPEKKSLDPVPTTPLLEDSVPNGASPCGWTAAAVSPIPILDQATTTVGSNLYTFAGVGGGAILATAQKFDGTTWTSIASVPVALEFPTAVSDGTFAYIVNGVDGTGTSQNTLYRYDPATNTYATMAPSPTGTWNQATAYLNGKIYKIGGYNSAGGTTTSSSAVEIYDIASNTWTTGASYPAAQGWMSAFAKGGFVYVAGGLGAETGAVPSTKTYRYDPGTNTWDDAAIADLPLSRWGAAASTDYNGGLVLAGGYVNGTAAANLSASAIQWNSSSNTWSDLPSMTQARARMSGAVLNGAFYVIGGRSSAGGFNGTNDNQRLFCPPLNQPFLTGSVAYVSDNGTPANGVPDPGENVTVSLTINNVGGGPTGNVVATLAASGGIANPSGPVAYGVINGGSSVSHNFTFDVPGNAVCGSQITLTFDVADGATHYTFTKTYNLGVLQVSLAQNFDSVTPPALPAGWTQNQTSGTGITWTTVNTPSSSSPNSAFANDPSGVNATALESPAFNVSSTNATVTFQNSYNTESTFDGAVLEIKIGAGAWQDIVTAGGAFTAGGYNGTISTSFQSPIAGRMAWTGSSNGFITSTATLPASANGQSVQLRWLMASDSSVAATGINIDDVSVAAGYLCNTTTDVKSRADFDGDGKTDLSVFRPSDGNWYINGSTAGFSALHWGATGDKVIPGDYDGDGKADYAVWRPSDAPGVADFYILNSNGFTLSGYSHGLTTDIPVPGDFDGDGKADIVVWRPSTGVFWVYGSQGQTTTSAQFGLTGDIPVSIDNDGDGKTNFAVYRPSDNTWYIAKPTGTPSQNFDAIQFGQAGDVLVPADYDGDNRDDVAVFRPSTGVWYILGSNNGFSAVQFGAPGDIAAPGDYDGDGKDDVAVYRSGVWYLNQSTAGFAAAAFGLAADTPIPSAYHP